MATGGFKPNAQTDFLEEWKAKREKMRLKMLGDIAAATGASAGHPGSGTPGAGTPAAPLGTSHSNKSTPNMELNNNGNVERGGGSAGNIASAALCQPIARSMSSPALKKPEAEPHPGPAPPGGNLKKQSDQKAPPPPCPSVESSPTAEVEEVDGDPSSPSPGKGKDKKCAGPSARKGKGQIEKRKLREKRRSTGVVSIPSNESLDELEDDDGGDRERKMEQQLVQANTVQNEAMTPSPGSPESPGPPGHLLQETPRSGGVRHKSPSAGGSAEEDMGGSPRQPAPRQPREPHTSGSLERRLEELEKELLRERQENNRLLKDNEENQDLICKLKEEIDLLNRDLDDIEDENDQLKQENKTLLKVVGQLTR
ncbi:PRKC apoptosis WT1 regulator protein [Gadus chalcogrammus]|uniref:PRKC apoptosis WT1 regulator protein n=1 Tax=Gadus chalcogrammus TaxID=1042646 RepID=UPI0024C499DE|nr:PRKC apoptosis WT1 regulator protein [Gadus chalcogrammus]XP_056434090.1 PRKC apoptosis WT1 regulator protein [Gadus chalcogrammus]XP_056434092.1 PRKC apoptosis WT1 regulator protein [Gadus chalcogrammus]XP_056434093.1 PRKC apoptosis WT1 regulator protein [Gadus chalcogrammus]